MGNRLFHNTATFLGTVESTSPEIQKLLVQIVGAATATNFFCLSAVQLGTAFAQDKNSGISDLKLNLFDSSASCTTYDHDKYFHSQSSFQHSPFTAVFSKDSSSATNNLTNDISPRASIQQNIPNLKLAFRLFVIPKKIRLPTFEENF